MYSLGIDTSQTIGQLILRSEKDSFATSWGPSEPHSEVITTSYSRLLDTNNIRPHQISKVYLVTGPGSFTGLRVGINFAKSLAYSYSLKITPLNSLFCLARSESQNGVFATAIDAQKNSVFCSKFQLEQNSLKPIFENKIIRIEEMSAFIDTSEFLIGSGWNRYSSFIRDKINPNYIIKDTQIDLKKVLDFEDSSHQDEAKNWQDVVPLYLKASAAEELLKNSR